MIEFDEAYFTVVTKESDQQKLKIGRGSQKQSNAAVMAESAPLEDPNTGKQSKHCRYFKMKGLNTHKKEEINTLIDGFAYKLNRRYFGENLFDRLVIAVSHQCQYKSV